MRFALHLLRARVESALYKVLLLVRELERGITVRHEVALRLPMRAVDFEAPEWREGLVAQLGGWLDSGLDSTAAGIAELSVARPAAGPTRLLVATMRGLTTLSRAASEAFEVSLQPPDRVLALLFLRRVHQHIGSLLTGRHAPALHSSVPQYLGRMVGYVGPVPRRVMRVLYGSDPMPLMVSPTAIQQRSVGNSFLKDLWLAAVARGGQWVLPKCGNTDCLKMFLDMDSLFAHLLEQGHHAASDANGKYLLGWASIHDVRKLIEQPLNAAQKDGLDALFTGESLVVLGRAGTGKTTLSQACFRLIAAVAYFAGLPTSLQEIAAKELNGYATPAADFCIPQRSWVFKLGYVVTATFTNRGAITTLAGLTRTLHNLFGHHFFNSSMDSHVLAELLLKNQQVLQRASRVQVLFMDEQWRQTMRDVHAYNLLLQTARRTYMLFGGVQTVAIGDGGQLLGFDKKSKGVVSAPLHPISGYLQQQVTTVELREIMRIRDRKFVENCNLLRQGVFDEGMADYFGSECGSDVRQFVSADERGNLVWHWEKAGFDQLTILTGKHSSSAEVNRECIMNSL
jgi:hypothetical protein